MHGAIMPDVIMQPQNVVARGRERERREKGERGREQERWSVFLFCHDEG